MLSYQFVFFQLFFQFSKIAFFKKGVQILFFFFSVFSVLSFFFETSLFLG